MTVASQSIGRLSPPHGEGAGGAEGGSGPAHKPGSGSRRLKDVALFARQLSMLVRTGTPLADALGAMERQLQEGSFREVVLDLRRQIEEGSTLAGAMTHHPAHFNSVCRSLIAAGESSGRLDAMLDRLSSLLHQQLQVRRTVVGALIYPGLLMIIGVTVVIVMLWFVLPRFEGLFQTLNAPLPPSTAFLLSVSEILRSRWWLFAAILALVVLLARVALSTERGRQRLDATLVWMPAVGKVTRSLLTARVARVLGVLLDSRIPLLDALDLTRDSTGNSLFFKLIADSEEAVARGENLSAVLAASPLISSYFSEALRHGEDSGQMSPVLLDMADFMDEENEVLVSMLSKLLEPAMLIVLGLVVATIALSLFMPLFDLTSLTHGG